MGSKRAQADRRERLVAAGVSDEDQARISAPVGLDLGATNARETALSIMAELAAVRHGREGGRLCNSKGKGRIHADAKAKA
jgi:xanthine dehydrogenase accessory factor